MRGETAGQRQGMEGHRWGQGLGPESRRRHGAAKGARGRKRGQGPEMCSPAGLGTPLQGGEGGMCEGPSRISGPIPPDPTLFPDYYRRPASGELGGGTAG